MRACSAAPVAAGVLPAETLAEGTAPAVRNALQPASSSEARIAKTTLDAAGHPPARLSRVFPATRLIINRPEPVSGPRNRRSLPLWSTAVAKIVDTAAHQPPDPDYPAPT